MWGGGGLWYFWSNLLDLLLLDYFSYHQKFIYLYLFFSLPSKCCPALHPCLPETCWPFLRWNFLFPRNPIFLSLSILKISPCISSRLLYPLNAIISLPQDFPTPIKTKTDLSSDSHSVIFSNFCSNLSSDYFSDHSTNSHSNSWSYLFSNSYSKISSESCSGLFSNIYLAPTSSLTLTYHSPNIAQTYSTNITLDSSPTLNLGWIPNGVSFVITPWNTNFT